ncbi:DUF6049 family protein [Pseudolysinimonas sp.]|uniref:DUF6049 family protein n=1 Tax=Pseudolysinimonas sp. TaxID=2680009 RepID=UPI003F7EA679
MRLTPRAGRAAVAAIAAASVVAGVLTTTVGAVADGRPGSSPAELAAARDLTPGVGPVSLAMLVPITLPTTPQAGTGLIDSDTLATDTAATGVLTRELNAVTGTSAVLAIDPRILVSIRILGRSAPASALDWLSQLTELPNEKLPLAYADADPAALADVPGGPELLSGLDFQFGVSSSNFGPARTASPTPTPTPSADAVTPGPTPTATGPAGPPPLPSNDDLVAAPGSYVATDIAWPADGTVSTADLAPLARAGYTSVILGSGNVSAATSARVQLDGIRGLVSDDGLSGIARDAVQSSGDAALQSELARFDAALAGMQAVSPGRSLIATLPRGWAVNALHVRELLQNVDAQPAAQTVGLSAVLAGPSADARVVDGTIPSDAAPLVAAVVATVAPEAAFATVAGERSSELTAPRRLELLSVMSVGWVQSSDGAWADRLRTYLASSARLLDSVKIVHGSSVLVTASSTNIPVTVSNALAVPVTVEVTITPVASTVLRVSDRRVELKVEPNATGRALVPAQALGSATVQARITLRSTADETVAIGAPDSIEVDLRPSWEGLGTGIIGAILILLFGGGITRQVLKRRRARRAREEPASDGARATTDDADTDADRDGATG